MLICPNTEILCTKKPCLHACSGQGRCVDGKCECNPGFEGDDCTPGCDLTCKTCQGLGKFNCTDCWDGGLYNGECKCEEGKEFSYYKKKCVYKNDISASETLGIMLAIFLV